MDLNSRLLIDDIILENVEGSVENVEMDMLMLLLCRGIERSLYQWKNLLSSVAPSLRTIKFGMHQARNSQLLRLR